MSKESVSYPFESRRADVSRQGDMNWEIIPPVDHVSSQSDRSGGISPSVDQQERVCEQTG